MKKSIIFLLVLTFIFGGLYVLEFKVYVHAAEKSSDFEESESLVFDFEKEKDLNIATQWKPDSSGFNKEKTNTMLDETYSYHGEKSLQINFDFTESQSEKALFYVNRYMSEEDYFVEGNIIIKMRFYIPEYMDIIIQNYCHVGEDYRWYDGSYLELDGNVILGKWFEIEIPVTNLKKKEQLREIGFMVINKGEADTDGVFWVDSITIIK